MRSYKARAAAVVVGVCCAVASSASADVVLMKNGDRITGKILSADGGKVVVTPDFDKSAKLTLAQGDIVTFSTTAPLRLKLKDGTTINRLVEQGAPGQVAAPAPIALAAIDKINPPVGPAWSGSVTVSGMESHGASDALTLGVSADVARKTDKTQITLGGAYNYGEQKTDGVQTTSADNWFLQGHYEDFLSKTLYAYATARVEADRVNFLDLRVTPGAGAGYQWINRGDFHLSTEAGASWIYENFSTNPGATSSAAVRFAYHIDKSWDHDRVKVFHDLSVLPSLGGVNQLLVQGDAGVRVALTKRMYSELKANATYDDKPAPGARDLTSQLLIGLGFTY